MAGVTVGSVHVDVVPSTRDFVKKMKKDILDEADKIGNELGQRIGRDAAESASRIISEGIEDGVDSADADASAVKKGRSAGGKFAREFKARVQQALRDLPEVDLEVDASELTAAQLQLRKFRQDLAALGDKTVGVDLTAGDAFAQLRVLREQLQLLRNRNVDVNFDIDSATASLTAMQKQLARDVGGTFENTFRDSLSNSLRNLPKIEIDGNSDRAQLALASIRRDIEAMSQAADVTIDIDSEVALADIERLSSRLRAIADNETLEFKVRADAQAALRTLGSVTSLKEGLERPVEIPVEVEDREVGEFLRRLRAQIAAATTALPDIDIDVNAPGAEQTLARIRTEFLALQELMDLDIDFDSADLLAEAVRLRGELEAILDDQTITYDIRVNAESALAAIERATGKRTVPVEIEPNVGAFARTVREQIQAITRNIPDIEIDADARPALAKAQQVATRLNLLDGQRIGIDISIEDAIREITILQGVLEAQINDVDVEAAFVSRRALADAITFRETLEAAFADAVQAEVEIETPALGATQAKLKADIERMAATLPDIQLTADSSQADREIFELRRTLSTLAANIDINTNSETVLLALAQVKAVIDAIDRDDINVDINTDLGSLLAQLAAARAAVLGVGDAVDNTSARMARWRLILAAVVLLLPLIAGAVVALAAALALVATPILAVVAGLDGIKKAIEPLRDELTALKAEVSAAFEQGLATSVVRAADAFPVFSAGLADTAGALSEVSNEILTVITSADNLALIERNFDLVNNVVRSLAPSLSSLAQNFTDFVTIGAQGMSSFGAEMTQVGETWARVIQRLSGDSGTGQAAVRAFFQVFAELLNLIGPLTELGAVMLATFGPAVAGALTILSGLFEGLAAVLDFLPGVFQTVATAALLVSTAMLILGRSGAGIALAFANIFAAAVSGAGGLAIFGAAARGLLAILGGPLGAAIIGVVTVLSILGTRQSAAAEAAAAHASAVQGLGDALEESNGVMTQSIRDQTAKTIIDAGGAEAAAALGLSVADVTAAVTEQGPAYETLTAKLRENVSAAEVLKSLQGDSTVALTEQNLATIAAGDASGKLLEIIGPLAEEFQLTAENIRLYQEATGQAVTTTLNGVANAAALSEAIGVLGTESSTTSDKIKALTQALDALNGGVLTAEEAAANLRESISGIGEAFDKANTAVGKVGQSLFMANGLINNTTEEGRALREELAGVRDSALESAVAAFDYAAGMGDIEGASAAAAAEVQLARDAIISSAPAADQASGAAANYANTLGLIPSLIVTLLRADNLPVINQDLITLQGRISGLEAGATVNVGIVADETLQVLRDIGVTVTTGLDGTSTITVDDQTAPAIANILGFIANSKGVLPVLGETTPAVIAAQEARDTIASAPANLPVELNRDGVGAALTAVRDQALNTVVEIPIGADDSVVRSKYEQVVANINASVGLVNIDGKAEPASVALANIVAAINAGEGFVNINGNDVPVSQALNDVVTLIGSSTAAVEIGGDNIPASQVLSDTLAAIAAGQEFVTINGVDLPAQSILSALLGDVAASSAAIQVLADAAAANAAIDNAARDRIARITVVTTGANASNISNSGLNSNSGQARGNYLVPMATGGILGTPLTPLAARANKIAPNTWRVIGDNMKVPEVYAPLDGSARSLSFLRAGIQSYGMDIAPMASGGLLDNALTLASSLIPQGSVQAQQVRPITAPGTPGTREANTIGFGTDRVENKLDEIAALLRENAGGSGGASITVNDRSGNPVETARATQLALRLARR